MARECREAEKEIEREGGKDNANYGGKKGKTTESSTWPCAGLVKARRNLWDEKLDERIAWDNGDKR